MDDPLDERVLWNMVILNINLIMDIWLFSIDLFLLFCSRCHSSHSQIFDWKEGAAEDCVTFSANRACGASQDWLWKNSEVFLCSLVV